MGPVLQLSAPPSKVPDLYFFLSMQQQCCIKMVLTCHSIYARCFTRKLKYKAKIGLLWLSILITESSDNFINPKFWNYKYILTKPPNKNTNKQQLALINIVLKFWLKVKIRSNKQNFQNLIISSLKKSQIVQIWLLNTEFKISEALIVLFPLACSERQHLTWDKIWNTADMYE